MNGRCGRAAFGIDKNHVPLALGSCAFSDDLGLQAGEALGEFSRVAHCGRAENIRRAGPVIGANAVQPPKNLGHMTAQEAPVSMHLIHHNIFQPGPERGPQFMVRAQGQVQHFRVGNKHIGRVEPDFTAKMIAGIAVVHGDFRPGGRRPVCGQTVEGPQLVLGQGFERKKIQSPAVRIDQKALQHGQVVNQ